MNYIDREALILIDLQRTMADRGRPPRNIIHVRRLPLEPMSGFYAGRPGADFQTAFIPSAIEHVVDQHVTDAFAGSGLERYLHLRSINKLVIAGVATNYSVEATARSAACLGFRVSVVSDACFTFSRDDFNGVLRTADEIHVASLSNLN